MSVLRVSEGGSVIEFSYQDLSKYHGFEFPGGVAHAYKVMERALPVLGDGADVERREVHIETAFSGPGARDSFEMVFRCVTESRFEVDLAMPAALNTIPSSSGFYYFEFRYRERRIALTVRPGQVRDEFVELGRKPDRTESEEVQLTEMKSEMANRLMQQSADAVYDVSIL